MAQEKTSQILDLLKTRSVLKQNVFDNTFQVFKQLKEVLQEMAEEYDAAATAIDERITIEYTDRGIYEAQLKIAGDLLVFSMFSNAFEFDRSHSVWKGSYVSDALDRSVCGMISVYNFLYDSFRYHRNGDLGYLIARIFINKELAYFVEGKQQMDNWVNHFGNTQINKEALRSVVDSAILYTLNFDLLVPPYDEVKVITLEQINSKIESSRMQTGKRLGFTFNSDDVSAIHHHNNDASASR